MTKRNIAVALFDPDCNVRNSNWPRFTGWKMIGKPYIESGLFGLVNKNTRMHRFFKDTDIKTVLRDELRYKMSTPDVIGSPGLIDWTEENKGFVRMNLPPLPDVRIRYLSPYTYIQEDGVEWDVYVVITGSNIFVKGDFQRSFVTDGYWDMGIWKPSEEELRDDVFRIEQATINHVISLGHPAMTPVTYFDDDPRYGEEYKEAQVYRELPDWGNVDFEKEEEKEPEIIYGSTRLPEAPPLPVEPEVQVPTHIN